jgi:hypothetical protein
MKMSRAFATLQPLNLALVRAMSLSIKRTMTRRDAPDTCKPANNNYIRNYKRYRRKRAMTSEKDKKQNPEQVERIYFLINGKKYEIRAQVPYRKQYLITLVEVTE